MNHFFTLLFVLGTILPLTAATKSEDDESNFISLRPEGVRNLGIQYEEVEIKDFERTIFAIGNIREIPTHHSVLCKGGCDK